MTGRYFEQENDMAGRYRKIDPRIWNDGKFSSLSHESQRLFLYILTHPSMTSLGAFRATRSGILEELGLDVKEFAEVFDEPFRKGLFKYDEKHAIIFAPNFLKYNPPENPNVVTGWAKSLDLIPECAMKLEVILKAKECAMSQKEGVQKAFAKSFNSVIETLSEEYAKPFEKSSPIQEQEQEYISTNVDKEKNTKKESQKTETEKPKKTRNAPLKKPDDVQSEQVWEDFLQIRKAKHAPLTETALAGIRREAEKAGISLEAALQTCCERGWQGFKADWYRKESYNGYSVNRKSEMPFPSDVSDFTGKPLVEPM